MLESCDSHLTNLEGRFCDAARWAAGPPHSGARSGATAAGPSACPAAHGTYTWIGGRGTGSRDMRGPLVSKERSGAF
eukprot:5074677-Pyramimonas_sp.AAC.1